MAEGSQPADSAEIPRQEVNEALAEIRWEAKKAALIQSLSEAVCALLLVNLVVGLVGGDVFSNSIVGSLPASVPPVRLTVGTVVVVVLGCGVFCASSVWRSRQPVTERFEHANPEVHETLRTARDTVDRERDDEMARALYTDVLDKLRDTSSVGLIHTKWVSVLVVCSLVLSLGTVHAAVLGIEFTPAPETDGGSELGSGQVPADPREEDLRDADAVLGTPTDVRSGSQEFTAEVGGAPGGDGQRDGEREYVDATDGTSGGSVDPERSGFASPEQIEEADLVRRYASELQGNTTDD